MTEQEFLQQHPELENESKDWQHQCYQEYLEELNGSIDQMEQESY